MNELEKAYRDAVILEETLRRLAEIAKRYERLLKKRAKRNK